MAGVIMVLMIYNFNIFFGPKRGTELPLRKGERLVDTSFHKDGYENAWIKNIDEKQGLVLVRTVEVQMRIVFRPTQNDLHNFNKGWIAPVTFDCGQKSKEKCDLSKPYKLYVSNVLVEPIEISQ